MGFAIKGQEEKVLELKKVLYGLKQAPRAWNSRIDKYFQDSGFVRFQHEYALYVKKIDNGDILLVCLYVDDLIFTGNNPNLFKDFKKVMSCEFEMTNIGLMSYYLGLEVKQMNNDIFVSQESYAKKAPTFTHMKAAKRILCYLKGTLDFGLFYSSSNEFKLIDFARDVDDRKSTTSFVFFMGDCAFTWNSKKQGIVTLFTSEYVVVTSCMC
ncbi:hypothetical protein CR513_09053, partial [Mucuna pruriens]